MTTHVGLDDFNSVPSLADVNVPQVRVVSYTDFASTDEETADPLLGTESQTILPVGGMLLMYGDGGAGKTTLTIDGVAHLGAGVPWLGLEVDRPVRTLLIENEGPRGKFRAKLAEKLASWNGYPPYAANVVVMEDPWTRFNLREEQHRHALAVTISQHEIDLVVMGPLVTLGMVGGGTPDEVSDFERLILTTRQLVARPFGLWVVHHENKAGDVSGAWERVPDALIHVQAQGNGHTKVVMRKARWSDRDHGRTLNLHWVVESRSFVVAEEKTYDVYAEIAQLFSDDDRWRTAKEVKDAIGRNEDRCRKAMKDMASRPRSDHDQRPLLVFKRGPEGHGATAHCYRLYEGDPNLLDHLGSPGSPGDLYTGVGEGDLVIPPYKGSPVTGSPTPTTTMVQGDPDTVGSPDDDSDTSEPAF
jgi:AAA domain